MEAADLPALLLDLTRRRFSGMLELGNGRVTKRIAWADGLPTFAESSRPSEGLGALLVERGYLSAAEQARLEQRCAETGRRELACAIELQLLAPGELLRAVREHLEGCLVEIFAWPELQSGIRPASDDAAAGRGIDPLPVVLRGIAAHWSPERVVELLGPKALRIATAAPGARSLAARLRGVHDVERLLVCLDGRRTLGAGLHAAGMAGAFAVAWLLDAAGALRYADAAPGEEDLAREPQIEIVVAGSGGGSSDGTGLRRGPSLGSADGSQQAEALRADVERLHAGSDARSYYELLGVEPNASVAEVRQAYRSTAKRLHPDALARLGLDDLKEKANELFSRVSLAHATLADPVRRREYDEARAGGGGDAGDRLVRAEMFYRKALVLLRAGRFADALPLLESCTSLWPEEAVYQSDLGWALFKLGQPRLSEARQALERALALEPSSSLALFRLSLVLAALGEEEPAARLRARAQQLDPGLRAR